VIASDGDTEVVQWDTAAHSVPPAPFQPGS